MEKGCPKAVLLSSWPGPTVPFTLSFTPGTTPGPLPYPPAQQPSADWASLPSQAAAGAVPTEGNAGMPWSSWSGMGMSESGQKQLSRQFSALDGVSQALAAALQVSQCSLIQSLHKEFQGVSGKTPRGPQSYSAASHASASAAASADMQTAILQRHYHCEAACSFCTPHVWICNMQQCNTMRSYPQIGHR